MYTSIDPTPISGKLSNEIGYAHDAICLDFITTLEVFGTTHFTPYPLDHVKNIFVYFILGEGTHKPICS